MFPRDQSGAEQATWVPRLRHFRFHSQQIHVVLQLTYFWFSYDTDFRGCMVSFF